MGKRFYRNEHHIPEKPTSSPSSEDLTLIKTTILQQGQEREVETEDGTPVVVLFHPDYHRYVCLPNWTLDFNPPAIIRMGMRFSSVREGLYA